MSGMMTPGDPIAEYLDKLRAGLRVAPGEAELIVAEAEDHLRKTAAAAMAIGMTGRSPGLVLAGFFPAVAGPFDPGLVVAVCLALAVGYAARTVRTLHRKG